MGATSSRLGDRVRPPFTISRRTSAGLDERDEGIGRDVGTLDSYYDAQMTDQSQYVLIVHDQWPIPLDGPLPRHVVSIKTSASSLSIHVSAGAIVSGGTVRRSIFEGCHVHSDAEVEDAVLLNGVTSGVAAYVVRS